jgi:hypothetical protein
MKKGLGLLLILLAVGLGVGYVYFSGDRQDQPAGPTPGHKPGSQTVVILYGSEKKGFLGDPEVQQILQHSYGLRIDGTKMGSLEMSANGLEGVDALWPSSELAAAVFVSRHPAVSFKKNNVFSTPIVFYSWPAITEALIKVGIVEQRDQVFYITNLKQYLEMMLKKQTWKSIGLPYQNGSATIRCTDPRLSNSGYLLSGLLAIVMNDGQMVDEQNLEAYLPGLKDIFSAMGYMEHSSGILFDKYIKQGQGAFPMIANYESLLVEFYNAHPESHEVIKDNIRALIPEPTVWSEHPLIALTESGQALMEALQDETLQRIAWERFGFRTGGIMGMGKTADVLAALGLPKQIQSVTPLPAADVMEKILLSF